MIMTYKAPKQRSRTYSGDPALQKNVLLIVCALMLGAVVILSAMLIKNKDTQAVYETQIHVRMLGAVNSAINEVNSMSGVVTTSAATRLSRVRQYVYLMEQLNQMLQAVSGGGQLISGDQIAYLFEALDSFESAIQQSVSNPLDLRTQLLNQLTEIQTQLRMY